MKTKKMLLFTTILLLMVSPTTVQARKANSDKPAVDVEQANQLSWPELANSLLGIPDEVEGFRCCQLVNGLIFQLTQLEKDTDLMLYEKFYEAGDPEVETPICESVIEAFEEYTDMLVVFSIDSGNDGVYMLKVMKLEAISWEEGECI